MQQIVLLLLAEGDATRVRNPMEQAPWVDREYALAAAEGADARAACWAAVTRGAPDAAFGRRVWKTHCPFDLFPCGGGFSRGRVIVVVRNPKDAAVSMHRHYLQLREFAYTGPWEHFFRMFMAGDVGHGSWFDHVLSYDAARAALGARLLWVTFENLKDDLPRELARIAAFLGTRADGATLAAVAAASSFESMRADHLRRLEDQQLLQCARGHFRSGRNGGWADVFTVAQSIEVDVAFARRFAGRAALLAEQRHVFYTPLFLEGPLAGPAAPRVAFEPEGRRARARSGALAALAALAACALLFRSAASRSAK